MSEELTMTLATGSATLTNLAGLHARPAVKMTQLAKGFADTKIEFALLAEGPWVDAKSPVKMMRAKAPKGAVLHFRAEGPEAAAVLAAMIGLVEQKFDEE